MSVGLHIMTPTSIVVAGSGSTASIRADGGVDFATATSLSLNGVFTSTYDDYMIVIRNIGSTTQSNIEARFRVAGSDASAGNYSSQVLQAFSTSIAGSRAISQTFAFLGNTVSTSQNGQTVSVYGPALAQPTAWRTLDVNSRDSAWIKDFAGTHSLSTAYDGITIFPAAGNITGMVTVYGYAQ